MIRFPQTENNIQLVAGKLTGEALAWKDDIIAENSEHRKRLGDSVDISREMRLGRRGSFKF
jgi:hypothetical protein